MTLLFLLLALPGGLQGQGGFEGALDLCRDGRQPLPELCVSGLELFRSGRGDIMTGFSGGASLPGSASTLGRRVPGVPRIGVSGSLQAQRMQLPDLTSGDGAGGGLSTGSGTLVTLRGTVAGGLFQGFSPQPTVGGILAVDLLGTAGYSVLPGGAGFEEGAFGWGAGVRVGILRESFTLPGVTLSVVRHAVGRARVASPSGTALSFTSSAWSTRIVAGKDLFGLGVYAGAGRDRASGAMELAPAPGAPDATFRQEGLPESRTILFGGAAYTLLVTQISGELGWSSGLDAVDGGPERGIPASDGTLFVRLSGRILF